MEPLHRISTTFAFLVFACRLVVLDILNLLYSRFLLNFNLQTCKQM